MSGTHTHIAAKTGEQFEALKVLLAESFDCAAYMEDVSDLYQRPEIAVMQLNREQKKALETFGFEVRDVRLAPNFSS